MGMLTLYSLFGNPKHDGIGHELLSVLLCKAQCEH